MRPYECNLKSHGHLQLELHARYPLRPGEEKVHYFLDMYIFTPSQLDINKEHYGVKQFLHDLQCYTRYTHPSLPLKRLMDMDCPISPLTKIRKTLENATTHRDIDADKMLYELRMLVNIYRGELRETRHIIRQRISDGIQDDELFAKIDEMLNEESELLRQVRNLRSNFLDPRIPEMLREGLRNADETMSLHTEKELFSLYHLISDRPALKDLTNKILHKLQEERNHRIQSGYKTIISADTPATNDNFNYYDSMLKRWSQSTMYMDVTPSKVASQISQVVAGIAAGLAMAVAVIATIFAQNNFKENSLPWALLIIFAYIIKDRMKELTRSVFIAKIPGLVSDVSTKLVDPATKRQVGTTRSWVRFCKPKDIEENILRFRDAHSLPFRKLLPPENVIYYQKRFKLESDKFLSAHSRIDSITEILRLNLNKWLSEMDDPISIREYIDANGKPATIESNRGYHVNIILHMSSDQKDMNDILKRYRVVVSRNGIIRVEEVEM